MVAEKSTRGKAACGKLVIFTGQWFITGTYFLGLRTKTTNLTGAVTKLSEEAFQQIGGAGQFFVREGVQRYPRCPALKLERVPFRDDYVATVTYSI